MKATYNQFIGMYHQVFPDYFCQHIIDEFEKFNKFGIVHNRQETENSPKHNKQDLFCFLNFKNHSLSSFRNRDANRVFWEGLQECFNDYVDEYDILKDLDIRCTSVKIQKTEPGGGYHVWHCEQNNGDMANRCLVYAIYLNNLDEDSAGETEFLYQQLRIPPKENCCIIWPAGFTHPHRGNVVYGNKSKYIVTGWFHLE